MLHVTLFQKLHGLVAPECIPVIRDIALPASQPDWMPIEWRLGKEGVQQGEEQSP